MTEIYIIQDLPAGIALAEMRKRGWSIQNTNKFGDQKVKGDKISVEMVSECYFYKLGK